MDERQPLHKLVKGSPLCAIYEKKRSLHSGIKQSPYKVMFGIEPRVGLTTSALPSAVIKNIHDEDELQKVIEQVNAKEEQNETEDKEDAEETLGGTQSNISSARKEAHENLQKQANRMKLISYAALPPVDVGGNVIILIPDVDRAEAYLQNIVAVTLDKSEKGLYKTGTKDGVADKLYCR
jgi:hypothetical protein